MTKRKMKGIMFIALSLSLASAFRLTAFDECSSAKKCRCTKSNDKEDIEVRCKNVSSEDIVNLPFENITSIMFTSSSLANLSILQGLGSYKQEDKSVNVSFLKTKLSRFSWENMPSNLNKLSLSHTQTENIFFKRTKTKNGSYTYECKMKHLKKLSVLYIAVQKAMKSIPSCIPNQLQSLVLTNINLSNMGSEKGSDIHWPESLKILQFFNNSITKFSHRIAKKFPPNLTSITIRRQPLIDSSILLKLPATKLRYLRVQNTQIKLVPKSHLANFRQSGTLTSFAMTFSELYAIPQGIPSSVKKLHFENNKIKSLDMSAFAHMKNLEFLALSRNLLQMVTTGLPASLKQIELSHNQIISCHKDAFSQMKNLTRLELSNNRLTSMPKNIPHSILHYDLKGNKISDVGDGPSYEFCSKCRTFNLASNPWACNTNMIQFLLWRTTVNIQDLPKRPQIVRCKSDSTELNGLVLKRIMARMVVFRNLGCFYNVTMINCTATTTTMTKLPDLPAGNNIRQLYLLDIPTLGNSLDKNFAQLNALYELELVNVGLKRLPTALPRSILHLKLSQNNITELTKKDGNVLKELTNIVSLNFSENQLETVPLNYIQSLTSLESMDLSKNPLNCNCELWPFVSWLKNKKDNDDKKFREKYGHATCEEPRTKKGVDITELTEFYLYEEVCIPVECYWNQKTPAINCSYFSQKARNGKVNLKHLPRIKGIKYWLTIDLSGLKLEDLVVRLGHISNLTTVNLANNSLRDFPIYGLPKTVVNLNIANNDIATLPALDALRKQLPELLCVDLKNNQIKTLNEKDFRVFPYLKKLKLNGNPLTCKCELSPLVAWISANKNNPSVTRNHELQKLTCHAPHNLAGRVIANLTESEYCPAVNVPAITGGLVGGVLLFILLAVVSNIFIHRQCKIREREAILQGFRDLLQQEAAFNDVDPETGVEDSGRFKYDAFVSYSPHEEDTEFVMLLLDELEVGHQYKLCAHERDFVPGIGIADNIVECIGTSKRIILILSRNFLSSSWCQYEVQVALTELHQKRKSKLLIPILLEDLNDNVEGSVKTFISLIKGIRIPSNTSHSSWTTFWKEVKEAMPEDGMGDKIT